MAMWNLDANRITGKILPWSTISDSDSTPTGRSGHPKSPGVDPRPERPGGRAWRGSGLLARHRLDAGHRVLAVGIGDPEWSLACREAPKHGRVGDAWAIITELSISFRRTAS
jgi:hypothetical protein